MTLKGNPFEKFTAKKATSAGSTGGGGSWMTTKKRGRDDEQIERDRLDVIDKRKRSRSNQNRRKSQATTTSTKKGTASKSVGKGKTTRNNKRAKTRNTIAIELSDEDSFIANDSEDIESEVSEEDFVIEESDEEEEFDEASFNEDDYDDDDDDDDDDERNEEKEDSDAGIEKEGNINHYEYPPRQHQQPHRQRQCQQKETVDIDLDAGIEKEGSKNHYEYMQRQHQQPQNQQQDPMDIATEETRNDTIVITPNNSRQCTTSNTTHSNSYSTDNISNVDDEHSIKSTTTTTATAINTTTTQRDTSLSSNQLCLHNQGTKSQSAYSGDNSNIIDLSFNNNDTHHDNETEKYEGDKEEEEEECKTTSNCNALTCSTTQITNLGTSNDQGNHNVEKETMSIFNTLWEENEMDEFDLDETEEISKNRNDGGHEKRHQDCENAYVNNETIEEIKNKDSHPGGNTEEAELSHGIIVMKPNNNTCLSNNEELNNPKVCQISTSLDQHDFNINAEGKLQKNNAENHTASIFAAFEEDDLDAFDDENDDDD